MKAEIPAEMITKVIDTYSAGNSLREVGEVVDLSLQAVDRILKKHAPEIIRQPFIGNRMTPAQRLLYQVRT